jgi:hypothetical protein
MHSASPLTTMPLYASCKQLASNLVTTTQIEKKKYQFLNLILVKCSKEQQKLNSLAAKNKSGQKSKVVFHNS